MNDYADESARFQTYGYQLIEAHDDVRDMLDDLRSGKLPPRELSTHCLAFCETVTRHHTDEDRNVFPLLAERHPELREFLAALDRDHRMVTWMLQGLAADPSSREKLDGLAAFLETHFIGEEKRLFGVLNALGVR